VGKLTVDMRLKDVHSEFRHCLWCFMKIVLCFLISLKYFKMTCGCSVYSEDIYVGEFIFQLHNAAFCILFITLLHSLYPSV
jgi:hypothetical protein